MIGTFIFTVTVNLGCKHCKAVSTMQLGSGLTVVVTVTATGLRLFFGWAA